MQISGISSKYEVRKLTDKDVDVIYELAVENPLYYKHCPPEVSKDGIRAGMKALPPRKTYADKYYIGFWKENQLIAVMDLILKYPNEETAFVGFFMMAKEAQGCGNGTAVITEFCSYMKSQEYSFVRLGYAKGNPQSKAFWTKNGFEKTGIEYDNEAYTVVVLERRV